MQLYPQEMFPSKKLEEVYEKPWRETMGHDINMSLIVKNCFINLSDEELNSLAYSLKNVKFERMSLLDLLQALFKANKKTSLGPSSTF